MLFVTVGEACVVHLVGEHVLCLRSPDGEIQASEQMAWASAFRHCQRVFSLMRDGHACLWLWNPFGLESSAFDFFEYWQ